MEWGRADDATEPFARIDQSQEGVYTPASRRAAKDRKPYCSPELRTFAPPVKLDGDRPADRAMPVGIRRRSNGRSQRPSNGANDARLSHAERPGWPRSNGMSRRNRGKRRRPVAFIAPREEVCRKDGDRVFATRLRRSRRRRRPGPRRNGKTPQPRLSPPTN